MGNDPSPRNELVKGDWVGFYSRNPETVKLVSKGSCKFYNQPGEDRQLAAGVSHLSLVRGIINDPCTVLANLGAAAESPSALGVGTLNPEPPSSRYSIVHSPWTGEGVAFDRPRFSSISRRCGSTYGSNVRSAMARKFDAVNSSPKIKEKAVQAERLELERAKLQMRGTSLPPMLQQLILERAMQPLLDAANKK